MEEEPDPRELDLWLLESQVPGCTRERAERAYAQGREDVVRALPLARMSTLLADRETMVEFLLEQLPLGTHEEACARYDEAEGDVVDAVVQLQRDIGRRLNAPVWNAQWKQRLRIKTIFMLALLYRERYGRLEPAAEEALSQTTLVERPSPGSLPSFRTPDGARWTHTREEGWERRAPLTPASLGRAVRATEQLADAAEARGEARMALRARQTAAELQAHLDRENTPPPEAERPPPERTTVVHTPDGLERFTTYVVQTPHYERHILARARGPLSLREASDTESEAEPGPTLLASDSSDSDASDEEATAGAYARPRAYVSRAQTQRTRREAFKRHLRVIQEQLDTEAASAAQGRVMSEGGYVSMMNAIKSLWELTDPPSPAEVN